MRLQLFLGGLFFAGAALPASASGGLECTANDKSVNFSVYASLTSGMGNPAYDLAGKLEIRDKAVAQDLRTMTFGGADRPQYWLDSKDLRLILYKEREGNGPFGSVTLELRARRASDEGKFRGTYKLSTEDMTDSNVEGGNATTFSGNISCFVE
ncbi:hypothetical protein [Shinella zoogloeoides]|uniref:Uncharacterized protein n=1 Tax=Shinella zoogloeoides TaxID=352475 RepID=A0A6N8TJ30_SHIZO|nr:hypothetical protein [Shinella zoogloeoides]MXO02445.1 hypothetical protein [Shinella zoogloeoides]UEX80371.1 hypothetical protein K8M09_12160 [Shinella zoogloeoides]